MKVFKFFIFVLALALALVSCSKDDKTIPDLTAPVITLIDSSVVNVLQGTTYTDAGATATDSVDGDISASIIVVNLVNNDLAGTYTISYNVSDAAGNAALEVTRTVNVIPPDVTAPIISLLASSDIEVKQGDTYIDAGATAYDNVDGDITNSIIVLNQVNTALIGTYNVTFNISDAAGNAAVEVTRTVNVIKSVLGNKYESTYLKADITGLTTFHIELKNKEEFIAKNLYEVIEFRLGEAFFINDVQAGTWTEDGTIVTVIGESDIYVYTVDGDVIKFYEHEAEGGDSSTIEMHYTKI